jgi:hypothetical protein
MTQLDIYEISGKKIKRFELDQPTTKFESQISMAEGVYLLVAKLKNGNVISRKLINTK